MTIRVIPIHFTEQGDVQSRVKKEIENLEREGFEIVERAVNTTLMPMEASSIAVAGQQQGPQIIPVQHVTYILEKR